MEEETLKVLEENKLIGAIRASSPEDAEEAARAAIDGGLKLIEISMNTPQALKVVENLLKVNNILVGVGSVLDGEMAQKAINAGAKFVVSPYTDKDVINLCKNYNVLTCQGVATLTEIINAHRMGAELLKIFPCHLLGGVEYVKTIKGLMPFLKLIPSGGLNLDNVLEYIKLGVSAVILGGSVFEKGLIRSKNWKEISEKANQFVQKLETVKATK